MSQRLKIERILMKIKDTYEYQFPTYALCALFYGDYDGLEKEDIANFESFQERTKHIDVFDDKEPDQEPYFCSNPEFGLACNVIDLVGIEFES
tara:strand:+ start:269 stop:547 length:279 start_codon:yes stop_codon:yes gene_type:complete